MSGNSDIYQKAMNQGHSAAWDRQWEQAANFYYQALTEFPDDAKALSSLGLVLMELQQYDDALECYQRVSELTPNDPLPFEKYSQLCEKLGRVPEAIQIGLQAADLYIKNRDIQKAVQNWSRVTRLAPDNITAHSRLAATYQHLGRKADAVSEYLTVASLIQSAGDSARAMQAVNYALQIMPESYEARRALTMISSNQMLPRPEKPRLSPGAAAAQPAPAKSQAAQETEPAEKSRDPISEARQKALIVLAGILFEQAQEAPPSQSLRTLKSIERNSDGGRSQQSGPSQFWMMLTQAVDLQTQGINDQAVVELEHAIDAGLNSPAAFFDLGLLQFQLGRYDECLQTLQEAVKHPDYTLASRLMRADCLRQADRLGEAAVEYLEALKTADCIVAGPENAAMLAQLYEPMIESQRRQTDEKVLTELCDKISAYLNRAEWRSFLSQARHQMSAGIPMPVVDMLLQTENTASMDCLMRVRTLAETAQVRTAIEEAFFGLQSAPGFLPLHIQIAELLLKENLMRPAIEKYALVARSYAMRGDMVQSTQILRKVIQLDPMDMVVRQVLIDQLVSQGMFDEAIKEYMDLANNYYMQAEVDMARKTYANALRLAPRSSSNQTWSVQILNRMADIDMQRLDMRQALRVLEQIRTIQPEDEKTRFNIIDMYFRLAQDGMALNELDSYMTYMQGSSNPQNMIAFVQGVINEHSDKIELRKRLATAYRNAGRLGDAVAELDMVGEQLMRTGNYKDAVTVIQTIINLNPVNVADYRSLLAQIQRGA
ncbi:MAG TPA: tetratricopeptide repeat protein [Anaerolineaceae bacterium]|nr:tetratricopeptide repeat protein [Anaerolineaceae bacterium]HPN51842.1 tetratricopeptide repeat protein [Anaerolineaceae bacterium]